jgi:ATP/maltotriose-dependent transcriptional regulator MalT/DNA-binding SARP family transcriptional activator
MTRASKTLPPETPSATIERPALEGRLEDAKARRLTVLVAGAGFGKTTLLARWAARTGSAWYTIEREDAALGVFATGILAAFRQRGVDLPPEIVEASGRPGAPGAEERSRAEALANHVSDALEERLTGDFALVLDDLQELDAASPAMRLVEGLCRHAPPKLHLVLASRSEVPFPVERLRGRGEVLDLGPSQLAFSVEELRELLSVAVGEELVDLAEPLHEATAGWPAAVRLGLEAIRVVDPGRAGEVLSGLLSPIGPLFAYLAEEVFAREPEEVREVLRRVAPFDRFSLALCETLDLEDATAILTRLARRGLFLQPRAGPGDWFVLHDLVRQFVRQSWPLEDRALRALYRRAARWFEEQGLLAEALRSLAAAADVGEVARLLAERGEELLARGEVDTVIELGGRVAVEARLPALEELLGEAYTVRGQPEEAQACFRRAAGGALDLPPRLAWRIGLLHHERGEHERALEVFARGRLDRSRPEEVAVLLAARATTHLLMGDVDRCLELCDRAAAVAGDDRALAAIHATRMLEASGRDPQAAEDHYRQALAGAQRAGDVLLEIRLRTNHASQLDFEGAYVEALTELDSAIGLAELAGYTERLALGLNNRGWTRFHRGRLGEAIDDLERSKALYQSAGSIRAGWPLMHLGIVYRERGDLVLARTALEESLALAEEMNDVQGLIGARSNLARLLAVEDPERATRLAELAIETGRTWFGLVDALIAAGWVALAQGRAEAAASRAAEARRESLARRNRPGLAESLELQAFTGGDAASVETDLKEAISIWREIGNELGEARAELALARLSSSVGARSQAERAERRLREIGVRTHAAGGATGALAMLPRETGLPIEIRTLGGFRVIRNGKAVTTSEWRSKKARDLLKILITRRGRPILREALMEALWPDEDPGPLPKRLSVAMATARGVLDPERSFPTDHFLAGDDASVRIDLANVSIDVEEFLTEAAAGIALLRRGRTQEAREVLAAAEASYAGDFLEEDLYEDWSTALREEARATYIVVARSLADAAAEMGDRWAAVNYRLRVLERDPYDEDAHLGLVSTLSAAGRHGEARRFYRAYVARMEELGVEPAPLPPPAV